MKPILFNTDMVRAILEDRKTVTRRAVKLHANDETFVCIKYLDSPYVVFSKGKSTGYEFVRLPYRPGDILYVRETWAVWPPTYGTIPEIIYKADGYSQSHKMKWRPSIHMPREAARIFLRVTDVRVERLQDITEERALLEGARKEYQHYHDNVITAREVYRGIWESTIKPKDRALYGWEANPWVWVIEFERCEKSERG